MTTPSSTADLEAWLDGASGRVVLRQATYWDVELSRPDGSRDAGRIHFGRGADRRFVEATFALAALHTTHPVLLEHVEASATLFVAAPVDDVEAVAGAIAVAIHTATSGWRTLTDYRDRQPPVETVLRAGFGHVMTAAHSVVDAVMPILERAGAVPHLVDTSGPEATCHHRVLVLGASYIISTTFRLEPRSVPRGPS